MLQVGQSHLPAAFGGAFHGTGDHGGALQIVGGMTLRVAVLADGRYELREQRIATVAAGAIGEDLLAPPLVGPVQVGVPDLVAFPGDRAARTLDPPLAVP